MFYYYYITVLYLSGYSVNGHFSIRVRVWYYFIFRDRYMKKRPSFVEAELEQNGGLATRDYRTAA